MSRPGRDLSMEYPPTPTSDSSERKAHIQDVELKERSDDGSIGPIGTNRMPDAIAPPHTCFTSSADYELALILKEIRFITDQERQKYEKKTKKAILRRIGSLQQW
uniref:Uncharacterized protein n=1 Tax=Anopheles culicifacies TaxID=139723 RepID=A0A182MIF6_9DIPT